MGKMPFFVYGTLLPDQPNFPTWPASLQRPQKARFEGGQLYDLGHFPMLVEAATGAVHGRLMRVADDDYPTTLAKLDALERYEPGRDDNVYRRRARPVTLDDGKEVTAWVYLGRARYVAGLSPIAGGDWQTYVADLQHEIAAWWATVGHSLIGHPLFDTPGAPEGRASGA